MNFIEMESAQKLRGGYYTPTDLAAFMVRWTKEINPQRVLEPSCGDGAFFDAIAREGGWFQDTNVVGFELDGEEAGKARKRARELGLEKVQVKAEDFLQWALHRMDADDERFDAVVGNPPFVRYQYLPNPFQIRAESIFRKLRLPFTKHTNAWVSFVLASMALLRPGGRLAMVVPSEIIHVTHAQSLRSYLGRECRRLVIIDPETLWFSDTLQGAVILLAEKKESVRSKTEGIGIYPVKNREFLRLQPSTIFRRPEAINGETVQGKWTRALLDTKTRSLFDDLTKHTDVHKFKDVAGVDVGIVTGANKYFLVPDEVVESYSLNRWSHPMFGRSEHCPGVIYDEHQHEANANKGLPTNFLWFDKNVEQIDDSVKAYIKLGEEQNLHTRYKCRIRSPWYVVPSVYSTEIGMLKRAHDTPRLILNRIGAYTTDTAYRIRSSGTTAEKLVGSFINPLTALSAELEGRHYGGGVLELIPSEIERLIIPLAPKLSVDLAALDKAIRTQPAQQVLWDQGKLILGAMELPQADQECIFEGWRKLRDRRQRTSSEPQAEAS